MLEVLIMAMCVMDISAPPVSHDLQKLFHPGSSSKGESLPPVGHYRNQQQHWIHHFALSNFTWEC
jgi:hypothetical protein